MKACIVLVVLVASIVVASATHSTQEDYDKCFNEIETNLKLIEVPDLILRLDAAVSADPLSPQAIYDMQNVNSLLDYYTNSIHASETEKEELRELCDNYILSARSAIEEAASCPEEKGDEFLVEMMEHPELAKLMSRASACVTITY